MKKIFIILTLIIFFLVGIIFLTALPKLEKDLISQLQNLGFKHVKIEQTTLSLSGLNINKITLDANNLNIAKNIQITLNWPVYLFHKRINSIVIEEFNLTGSTKNIKKILSPSYSKNYDLRKLSNINSETISIKKMLWNATNTQGIVTFEASALIQKNEDKSQHDLTASIQTQQKQLSFQSQWKGIIDKNNNIQIDGVFTDFKINYPPAQINRGTGWLTYQSTDKGSNIAGQIDAGSGKIFSVPVNNIALIIGQEKDYYPILLRAQASGIEDVRLTMDMHYTDKYEDQTFETTLSIRNPISFFEYLQKQNIASTKISFKNIKNAPTSISVSYLAEKRFADGPFPFSLNIKQSLKQALKGTLLIYPNSLDIRGTIEINKDLLELSQSLWPVKKENISKNIIRIDGNLKPLLPHLSNQVQKP